ncbi:hypothetical protein [Lacrimispora indolis]|uniref:hypothetical protein n=1 Tax=Lacrimispora indolis TaxID=69825 RepID=UPI00045EB789|nr:hypothetical protein [Lacrimispora indolis]
MDKRKIAEIILQAIDDHGPVQVNWSMENQWISAILRGLTMVDMAEKVETPGAATPRESR